MIVQRFLTSLLVALVVLLPSAPLAQAVQPRVSLTAVEMQYMCTSCHEPLPLAQSPQAQSEKQYLASLVDQGLSAKQIQHQMVAQYGVAVLGKPPAHGFNLTIYILPPAILLIGIAGLLYALPKWRERSRLAATQEPESAPALSASDAKRLDEDIARFS
jgi:cytochrome c-type biogenesis protein CcmH